MINILEWLVDFWHWFRGGLQDAWETCFGLCMKPDFTIYIPGAGDKFGDANEFPEGEQDYMTTSFSYYRPIKDFQCEPNRPNPAMICQYKDCNNRPMSGAFYCYEHRYGVAEGTVPGLLEAITTGFTVTKRCKHCRQLNGDEQLYCEHCGAEL